MNSNTFRIRI